MVGTTVHPHKSPMHCGGLPEFIFSAAVCFLSTLSAAGCHEDTPTQPNGRSGEVRTTVGPSGGTVAASDFTLRIPAGAFSTSTTITVASLSSTHPFGTDGTSRFFALMGLPAEFTSPLKLSILPASPTPGIHFVAMGCKAPLSVLGSESMVFTFLQATDSAGWYTCDIPPRAGSPNYPPSSMTQGGQRLTEDEIDLLIALGGYDTTRSEHFALYAPTFVTKEVKTASLAALQEARAKLLAMGLPFQPSSSWCPIEAHALRFNNQPNTIAAYVPRPPRIRAHADPSAASVICLNVDRMVQAEIPILRAQCGREAFSFVPQAAFGLAGYEKFTTPDAYWLHMAMGSWFEEKMMGDPTHVPSEFAGNELQPLQGILAGAGSTAPSSRKHGLGLSALMKFLINRYSESMVWRVYQDLQGGLQHVNALLNSMADPPSEWYSDFLREYLTGNIYGVSAQTFLSNTHGTARIQSAKDTLFQYQVSYPDLSARLFLVDLAFPEIAENASLRITLTPSDILGSHGSLMVFGVQGGALVSWTEGRDITITKLKDLTAGGTKILIAAVNSSSDMPYDAPLGADLRLQVVVPGYRHLYFKLFMGANYRARNTRTQRDTLWTNMSVSINGNATGTTTGTVYTADTVLTGTLGGATDTLRAKIELDDKHPTLIRRLTISRWGMRDTTRVGWSVWGHDLPVTSSAPGAFAAEVIGLSVGSHIDSVQYQNWVLDGKYLIRLIECWGADASEFRVALSEYPLVEKRAVGQ